MSVHLTKNGICMHAGSQTVYITIYPADGSLLTKTVFKTGSVREGRAANQRNAVRPDQGTDSGSDDPKNEK